ncbi:MAG: DUF2182 domain-containing protein [Gammaproteobacteria bacterium]
MLTEPTRLETMVRRDRTVVVAGLAAVTLVAWIYLLSMASRMNAADAMGVMDMAPEMAMPAMQGWGAVELLLLFVMWGVMMVAMMVPSVAPLVLMFARANRQKGSNRAVGSAGILLLGYLLVWAGFSVLATLAQWGLQGAALLSPMMVSTSSVLGGLLLMSHWREGQWGTFIMGLKHGAYCVGCCWLLMALLFVAGVMNLLWVAAIAVFVLVEKVAPRGDLIGRIAGGTLIVVGIALIVR